MSKENFVIGILGGMGTYATINLFRQYACVFPAKKEWERPRIIIDNRCTMPSRVRAFLYHENVETLVNEMTDSLDNLSKSGCNKILLACNTSHIFLPQIYKKLPDLESKVVNIVYNCVDEIQNDYIEKVFLLGSEGTIDYCIYQEELEKRKINCLVPNKDEYCKLRECIEAVKQNNYSESIKKTFIELVNRYDNVILGCTELPILYDKYKENINVKKIYDPVMLGLKKIKEDYDNE